MPSICNGSTAAPLVPAPSSTNGDVDTPCSKLLVTYLEKRTRNLDKRKAKLDGYLQKESAGEKLDRDQKDALKQLPVVVGMIECLKETTDHVIKTISEEEKKLEKQQRKLAKRQLIDGHKQTVNLFVQLTKLQKLLGLFNDRSFRENVKAGIYSSVTLADDELIKLDLLQQMLSPTVTEKSDLKLLSENAENAVNYLQGKDGSYGGCDFETFREIVKRFEDFEFLSSDASKAKEKEETAEEPTVVKTDGVPEAGKAVPTTTPDTNQIAGKPASPCKSLLEEVAEKTVQISKPDTHTSSYHPHPSAADAPARAVKEPQEILSAVRGSYNFLQDSEIEETEKTDGSLVGCGFNTFNSFVPLPSGYSVASAHGVHPDSHQLLVQQPVPFSGHLLTLPYPQNLVNESIYMAHGLPTGYTNGMAMTTPYTMHDAYSQPIVSHELNGMIVPTTAYYNMTDPVACDQQEVADHETFETVPASQTEAIEAVELSETSETQQDDEANTEAAANEPEKKKFSMNPNADVFRSKNYPGGEGEFATENTQGGFGGRRNGRGGRGGRGSHLGYQGRGNHRGQGYGGRGGGYSRYPRNDYRQDGQNGFASDFNGWHNNGPRRDRGGSGGHPRGRGGRGGYDRNGPQGGGGGDEAQE